MTPSEVQSVIDNLQKTGKLPAHITAPTRDAMAKSLNKYFGKIAADKISQFADKAKEVAEEALKTEQVSRPGMAETVTEGGSTATGRNILTSFLEDNAVTNIADTMNMDFFLRIAQEVANGAAQHIAQNFDQTRVDEFPALELHRVYDRRVPRGSELDKAGPENGWDDDEGRWPAACEEAGDDDAAEVFESTGRMVALKSSGVWQALGDGAGGYDDTLGNPFAPFAFNSGMDCDEVDYDEAVSLGLIDDGDEVEPAKIDFEDLIGAIE